MNKDFWERINKLEELAGKATPGTWIIKNDPEDRYDYDIAFITTTERQNASIGEIAQVSCYEPDIIEEPIVKEQIANAEYISAANPAMIKEMIAEMRRLEKEADWLAEELASVYKSEFEGTMDLLDVNGWREAARKVVMENKNV